MEAKFISLKLQEKQMKLTKKKKKRERNDIKLILHYYKNSLWCHYLQCHF